MVPVPAPSWMKLEKIGDKMITNGLPATVYAFSTARSAGDVFTWYRDAWQNRGGAEKAVREAYVPPWRVLSHVEGRLLYTVQIRDDARPGAIGYLAVTEPDNIRMTGKDDIPALAGSRTGNTVQFVDNGRKSQVLQLENSYTLEQNAAFYAKYYADHGWTPVNEHGGQGRQVLRFNRQEMEVNIVLNAIDGMTHVVVTQGSRE